MSLTNGQLVIIVRPSIRGALYPFTAYISWTQTEGFGRTVQEAVEDLFTSADAGKACARLEREVKS